MDSVATVQSQDQRLALRPLQMNNGTLLSFVCKSEESMRLGRLSAIGRDKRRGRPRGHDGSARDREIDGLCRVVG